MTWSRLRRAAWRASSRAAALAAALVVVTGCSPEPGRVVPAEQLESPAVAGAAPPIAQVESDIDGHHVELLEVSRISRGVLEIRFAIVNASGEGEATPLDSLLAADPEDAGTVADAFIVEPGLQKKYFVLRDSEGRPLSSRDVESLPPGGRVELWARFPVPVGDARTIEVHVPGARPFDDIEIPPAPGEDA